jgi:hypothetical protein
MNFILDWIIQLNPFYQSLLGAAVFSLSSWLVQKVFKKAKTSSSTFLDSYITLEIQKHILHKHYVRSKNIQLASYGSSIALLIASRFIIASFLCLIFVFGVQALLDGKWLYVAGAWCAFNCMFEARNWVKDSSTDDSIKHINKEKLEAVTSEMIPQYSQVTSHEKKAEPIEKPVD